MAGQIVDVDPKFEVGATFKEGEVIAKIDRVNFEAAEAQAQSTLADAKLNLVQEKARADQSARDWRKIGGGKVATDLVLRVPFMESARARVLAAEKALELAEEDLRRTEIKAPFNCRVRAVNLNRGATVAPGSQLGTIYDDQNLTIRLPFSMDDYAQIPDKSEIKLFTTISGQLYEWDAKMMWELGEVDQSTLSAYVLAKVTENSDQSRRFRLPVPGIFVNARLKGAALPGVVGVPRSAVRGRNQVFVLNEESKLEIRELTIARSTATNVYTTQGIEDGEEVILTKLEMPVAGMILKKSVAKDADESGAITIPN